MLGFRDGPHISFNLMFDRLPMLEQLGLILHPQRRGEPIRARVAVVGQGTSDRRHGLARTHSKQSNEGGVMGMDTRGSRRRKVAVAAVIAALAAAGSASARFRRCRRAIRSTTTRPPGSIQICRSTSRTRRTRTSSAARSSQPSLRCHGRSSAKRASGKKDQIFSRSFAVPAANPLGQASGRPAARAPSAAVPARARRSSAR